MKKQLLTAAIAATMASVSQADVSIKGNAHFSYSDISVNTTTDKYKEDAQRVNLTVMGKTGNTQVTAVIRNGSQTRVDWNAKSSLLKERDDEKSLHKKGLHMDSLYVTTKVGRINVKAGDYWETTGLGARSKGGNMENALSISTNVGPVKLKISTKDKSNNGAGSTKFGASMKAANATVMLTHNPDDYTDLSVKGMFKGIAIGVERFQDKTAAKNNTTLFHVGGKVKNIKWDVARIKNDVTYIKAVDAVPASTGVTAKEAVVGEGFRNAKFAPLGSMLIGSSARGGTTTAFLDVGDFSKITGVSVSSMIMGSTIKAIYTSSVLEIDNKIKSAELILTRNMGGAKLTFNIGRISGNNHTTLDPEYTTHKGLRLDVKF